MRWVGLLLAGLLTSSCANTEGSAACPEARSQPDQLARGDTATPTDTRGLDMRGDGTPRPVAEAGAAVQETPVIAVSSVGDFLVAWLEKDAGPETGRVWYRVFDQSGKARTEPRKIEAPEGQTHFEPVVCALGRQSPYYVVGWRSGKTSEHAQSVVVAEVSADGFVLGEPASVAEVSGKDASLQSLSAAAAGQWSCVLAWAAHDACMGPSGSESCFDQATQVVVHPSVTKGPADVVTIGGTAALLTLADAGGRGPYLLWQEVDPFDGSNYYPASRWYLRYVDIQGGQVSLGPPRKVKEEGNFLPDIGMNSAFVGGGALVVSGWTAAMALAPGVPSPSSSAVYVVPATDSPNYIVADSFHFGGSDCPDVAVAAADGTGFLAVVAGQGDGHEEEAGVAVHTYTLDLAADPVEAHDGPVFLLDAAPARNVAVAPLPDGSYVAAWEELSAGKDQPRVVMTLFRTDP